MPADIFLVNGIKLHGILLGYDKDAIFLRAAADLAATQMVLWGAVSTIASRGKDPE